MKNLKSLFISSLFVFCYLISSAQETENSIKVANDMDYNYFFKHLSYLASDELKGRNTGSEGYDKAAKYVANEFKENGLLPFGDNGTYFQNIKFVKPSIIESSIHILVKNQSKSLKGIYGKNISLLINGRHDKVDINQKLVFVGYGNIFPEEKINDYQGIDVKGKTVIVSLGGPKSLKNSAKDDLFAKIDNAVNNGADGIILYTHEYGALQGMLFGRIHTQLTAHSLFIADTTIRGGMLDFNLKLGAFAHKNFIEEILEQNGYELKSEVKKMEKGEFVSKELESTINCTYNVKKEYVFCKNIVTLLPGTDPDLKNEYVVVGGHLDHLGVGKAVKGDSIYNGLWDNASGSAGVISISKAFTQLQEKPKRSILFICYTGEEKGILGSQYFANRNEIKDGKIVAVMNMDMLGSLFETSDITPTGYSHSNLSEAVDFSAKAMNLIINDATRLEKTHFGSSDQISFVKKGVPAVNILQGKIALDPKIDGIKQINKSWDRYHEPSDDLNNIYSSKAFLTAIQVDFLTAYYIVNKMNEIKWNTESNIYKKYVRNN